MIINRGGNLGVAALPTTLLSSPLPGGEAVSPAAGAPLPAVPRNARSLAPRDGWDAQQVSTQLERILASAAFDASARNRTFLRYVVNETLAGRGDRIKAYTVAQEVFQRGPDFDPQLDPVVRIEAGHLRRSLERYYLTVGKGDPLVIDIPKGGYVPKFETREPDGKAGRHERRRPFVVLRFASPIGGSSEIAIAHASLIWLGKHILVALWVVALLLLLMIFR